MAVRALRAGAAAEREDFQPALIVNLNFPLPETNLLLATWFGPLWRFNLAHLLGR
jgi:hypothetical protein